MYINNTSILVFWEKILLPYLFMWKCARKIQILRIWSFKILKLIWCQFIQIITHSYFSCVMCHLFSLFYKWFQGYGWEKNICSVWRAWNFDIIHILLQSAHGYLQQHMTIWRKNNKWRILKTHFVRFIFEAKIWI